MMLLVSPVLGASGLPVSPGVPGFTVPGSAGCVTPYFNNKIGQVGKTRQVARLVFCASSVYKNFKITGFSFREARCPFYPHFKMLIIYDTIV